MNKLDPQSKELGKISGEQRLVGKIQVLKQKFAGKLSI